MFDHCHSQRFLGGSPLFLAIYRGLTPFIAGFWAHLAVACKLEQHGFWMEKAVGKTRSQEAGVIGGATVAYSLYQ